MVEREELSDHYRLMVLSPFNIIMPNSPFIFFISYCVIYSNKIIFASADSYYISVVW